MTRYAVSGKYKCTLCGQDFIMTEKLAGKRSPICPACYGAIEIEAIRMKLGGKKRESRRKRR